MSKSLLGFTLAVTVLLFASSGNAQEQQGRRRSQAVPGKEQPHPPQVDAEAPDFELKNLKQEVVSLQKLTEQGPVVILVLRGWPGYQCPICNRQVGEFLSRKAEFRNAGASVVMIYPGPADLLADHAKEFQGAKEFPENFHYVTDPDYVFTNAWGLRWEAPRETAYPSTFVIGKDRQVKFGLTSTSHGGRASAASVLKELEKLK
ncbi:MAG: AhpC/TSA family protein [Planctomycetaceae bacterium]|nr:AhpC/TSA family protein [Planctomycetaceae bacterium]